MSTRVINSCQSPYSGPFWRGSFIIARWGIFLVVATCLTAFPSRFATAQDEKVADSVPESTPTPDDLARWARQLDDDDYQVRRDATERLIRAGGPAANPVAQALTGARIEQLVRGLHVLHQLALSDNPKAEHEALRALDQLAKEDSELVRNRTQIELDSLVDVFQDRAIAKLSKLGAVIQRYPASFGGFLAETPPVFSIQIDDNWQGIPADLEQFQWLRDVPTVWLSGGKITDPWVPHLLAMKNIEYLRLHRAAISDQGLHQLLSHLPALTRLDVWYCDVTDAAFPHLAGRMMWDKVRLYGTPKITKAGEQRIKGFANEVDLRVGGGLMGISPITPDARQIGVVQPNTGAAKAGLRVQDIVRTFDGMPVRDFYHITQLIGQKKPGETIQVGILRAGRKIVLPVVLSEWPFNSR